MASQERHVPKRTEWLYRGFAWYANRMVKRSFEAMGVHDDEYRDRSIPSDMPVIVYANHPSWWDPILAVLLHEFSFSPRDFYAPIDAEALKKYEVFRKLGFYPTQMNSHTGAANFLKVSNAILDQSKSAIWLTPEGKFTDCRDHSLPLMPGLAHLFVSRSKLAAVPLAIEYAFWNERKPYMLMRLGEPVFSQELDQRNDKSAANELLTSHLRRNQAALAKLVMARTLEPFRLVKQTAARPANVYDWARLMKSFFKREPVQLRHGSD